jgi:hypothetical protein
MDIPESKFFNILSPPQKPSIVLVLGKGNIRIGRILSSPRDLIAFSRTRPKYVTLD